MTAPHMAPVPRGSGQRSYGGKPYFGVWSKTDARWIVVVGSKTYKVARLIAEAFHGQPPFEGAVVMHIDENSANNRADNLKWGTQNDNLNAPGFIAYCQSRTGENNPVIKAKRKREAEWFAKMKQGTLFAMSDTGVTMSST